MRSIAYKPHFLNQSICLVYQFFYSSYVHIQIVLEQVTKLFFVSQRYKINVWSPCASDSWRVCTQNLFVKEKETALFFLHNSFPWVVAFRWSTYFKAVNNYFHNHCGFANTLQNHSNHRNYNAVTVMETFHYVG